jgi:hypothetical protein
MDMTWLKFFNSEYLSNWSLVEFGGVVLWLTF